MVLTDNELGMIEQLTYLTPKVAEEAGIEGFEGFTSAKEGHDISTILGSFNENALRELERKGDQNIGFVSAKEWAGMIRYLQSSRMKDLVLTDTMTGEDGTTLALCFTEEDNSADAVVAFKGTSGGDEWADNVQGLNQSDTRCQKETLDFIESLSAENITVTGHSKGGNKAMYVAITSDKVTRCVAYDGQGFSQEFIDKYWAEIQAKGGNIKAYSLATDYVHALLFPVPNAEQIYCQGYGVANIGEHHSPNSLFMTDEKGRIVLDKSGNPIVVKISEDESVGMLHEFTTFVIHNANAEDKEEIIDFVSQMARKVFGGKDVPKEELIDLALGNPDAMALVGAYLVKYMDVQDLGAEDVDELLDMLGLKSLDELFTLRVKGHELLTLSEILEFTKKHLTDDNDDWWIRHTVLPALEKWMLKGYDIDLAELWEKINSKVREIDGSGGCADADARSGTIRDFSATVYETLISVIHQMESIDGVSVSSWSNYAEEEWYAPLRVSMVSAAVNEYFSKLSETNQMCKNRIDRVFDSVKEVDERIAERLVGHCQNFESANTGLKSAEGSISA